MRLFRWPHSPSRSDLITVILGLGPRIHDFAGPVPKSWMPGLCPGRACGEA